MVIDQNVSLLASSLTAVDIHVAVVAFVARSNGQPADCDLYHTAALIIRIEMFILFNYATHTLPSDRVVNDFQ